ncbi:MAG: FUSC family protein, partial [Janthinobacterium lividum]
FLSALLTGLATVNTLVLWLTAVTLTFVVSMGVVYGSKWPQITFAALFTMVVTLDRRLTPLAAVINAAWILLGALWYTYWSFFLTRWQEHRIERQAIVESIFAIAEYLHARAAFFLPEADLEECYRQLVDRQIDAVDRQDAARSIVLRNLPELRRGELDARRTRLFNLFIDSVDLHELVVSAHTDYARVRQAFGDADIMIFFHDLLRKSAHDLEEAGIAGLRGRATGARVRAKAELRAIEYELEQMRRKDVPSREAEAYSAVVSTYRRIWRASRLIEKIRADTQETGPSPALSLRVDASLSTFLSRRPVVIGRIFSNFTLSSPSFRHALRVALAVAVGLLLGKLLPIENGYWIVLTSVIILKPGFSLTRQRNTQRMIGTAIGCAVSVLLILTVKSSHILLVVMFVCMVTGYSLVLLNYGAAAVFITLYVLLLYHLLAPASLSVIGERAIDTVIGGLVAIAISYLFPFWEYRLMRPLVVQMISSMRGYLTALRGAVKSESEQSVAAAEAPPVGAAPTPPAPASHQAPQPSLLQASPHVGPAPSLKPSQAPAQPLQQPLQPDYRYRLARKNVYMAFANLGQAFQRMMREPKSAQRFVPELNDMLVQSHALVSHLSAAAPLITSLAQPGGNSLPALQRALALIDDDLLRAEQGAGPPDGYHDAVRSLSRQLDEMVAAAEAAEKAKGPMANVVESDSSAAANDTVRPQSVVQELKMLAHQCKQMLACSSLIRKDAQTIRLPLNNGAL